MEYNINNICVDVFKDHWQQIIYSINNCDDILGAEAIFQHVDIMVSIIIRECDEVKHSLGDILQFCDTNSIFQTIFIHFNRDNLKGNIKEYGIFNQLRMYDNILNFLPSSYLTEHQIVSPLLKLLEECSLRQSVKIEHLSVRLLYQLTILATRDVSLFEFIKNISDRDFHEPLFFISLIILLIHRDTDIGRLSQEALLLIFNYSREEDSDIVDYICNRSDFAAILDEMLDNGFPLVTESNILQELVRPPNVLRQISDKVTGQHTFIPDILPAGQLSMVPWRRAGVKYPSNEAYFDFIEVINTIIDKTGSVIISEVTGEIKANIHLSGIPDLTMYLNNPRLIDDLALHPCVRFSKWDNSKIFSFIPPEGVFTLCNYYVESKSNISLPVNIKSQSKIDENRSLLDLTIIGNKTLAKKPVENLVITIKFPKIVSTVVPQTCSHGKTRFNVTENSLIWTIGKLEQFVVATLKGPISLYNNSLTFQDMGIDVSASFQIDQCTISGLSVNKVELSGEKYAPYKGVKYMTKAGKYHLRS